MSMTTIRRHERTFTDRVAAEIRAWMGRRQVRQSQLARHLGENEQWLSTRLRGLTPINVNELDRIAEALEVDVVDLIPVTPRRRSDTDYMKPPAESRRPAANRPRDNRPGGHAPQPSFRRPVVLADQPAA